MERVFTAEDLGIQAVLDQGQREVEKTNALMRAKFDAMGVADDLRSEYRVFRLGGGYGSKDHRSELRRKVRVEADAAVKRRLAEIGAWEDDALKEVTLAGLTSDAARSMLEALPLVDETLPAIDDLLGPVEEQPLAVIDNTRESKRQAVLRALDKDGSRSNREIGRLLGVDHKTVGRIRADHAEIPNVGGEIPESDGELPAHEDGAS
jgi:hypothetical protein